MSDAEVTSFESHPDWRQAVQLRLLDDRGKVQGLTLPDISAFRPELSAVVSAVIRR